MTRTRAIKPSTRDSHPTTSNEPVTSRAIARAGRVRQTRSVTSTQVIPTHIEFFSNKVANATARGMAAAVIILIFRLDSSRRSNALVTASFATAGH